MNFRYVLKNLGNLLYVEAICLLLPLIFALIYDDFKVALAFVGSIIIVLLAGFLFKRIKSETNDLYARDGFALVAIGWILVSLFGAVPFILSGSIPSVFDAIFESISGFSTTGSTILIDVEAMPKSIILWRSFAQWLGGMGVLILMIAIIPSVKASSLHILKAEAPGPSTEKFVPKIKQVAKILYSIYLVLTLVQFVLLFFGGMSVFDSLVHAFSTGGTGGFSSKNESVAYFNSVYIEAVIAIFMVLFGVNFTLFHFALKRNFKAIFKDEELRFYLLCIVSATVLILFNVKQEIFASFFEAFRYSSFQVVSLITSTGFMSFDYNSWPVFSHIILLFIMFMGASAGSTSGGFTAIRFLVLIKTFRRSILKAIHPNSVRIVKINNKAISEELISNIMMFFFAYMSIFFIGSLLISIDGKDFVTSTTAVLSAISNTGPGLNMVGPAGNYAEFSDFSKMILSLCMLVGRLEIYPILLLFAPSFWKK